MGILLKSHNRVLLVWLQCYSLLVVFLTCCQVVWSLVATMRALRVRNNTSKLSLYKHFAVAVLVSAGGNIFVHKLSDMYVML